MVTVNIATVQQAKHANPEIRTAFGNPTSSNSLLRNIGNTMPPALDPDMARPIAVPRYLRKCVDTEEIEG